jgi:tetratricopeptide (TPR) repeat protein
MYKRLIITIVLIMITTAGLIFGNLFLVEARSSTTAKALMQSAGQSYQAGQIELAAQTYQQLVDQGYGGAELFYNLGTAYLQQGNSGQAIANLRRAQRISPRDSDVTTNLTLARSRVETEMTEAQTSQDNPALQLGQMTQRWFSLNEIAMVALTTWVAFVLLVVLYTGSRKNGKFRKILQYLLLPASLALILSIITFGSYLYLDSTRTEAVIIADEIAAHSGPGTHYSSTFNLVNGIETTMVEARGSWHHLMVPHTSLDGWVPANAVEVID